MVVDIRGQLGWGGAIQTFQIQTSAHFTDVHYTEHKGWLNALNNNLIIKAHWAPLYSSSTSTLFIKFNDSSTAALANFLAGTTLHFSNSHHCCMGQEP